MPVVPTYGDTKVAPEAVPNARIGAQVTPQALGSDIAKGVGDIAGVQRDAYLREKQRQDQIAAQDAENQMAQRQQDLLYNPETGALNTKGKQAFGIHDTVLKAFDDDTSKIEAGLSNQTQIDAFQQARAQRKLELTGALDRHVAQQAEAYDQETFKATIETSHQDALTNYNDPKRVAVEAGRQATAISNYASRNGMSPEWTTQAMGDTLSKTYSAVTLRMNDAGDFRGAKAYYEENKGHILGADRERVDGALKVGSLRGEAQAKSDAIVLSATERMDALKEVQKIEDPELRDETDKYVNRYYNQMEQANQEHQRNLFVQSAQLVDLAGGNLDAVPPSDLFALEPEKRHALEQYATRKQAGPIQTNWDTYYKLRVQAASEGTRDAFMKRDLSLDRPNLSDAHFKEMVDLQADIIKDPGKADKTLAGINTRERVVKQALAGLQIAPNADEDPKATEYDRSFARQYRKVLDEQVDALQAQTKKPATPEEVQAISDKLLTVTDKGGFWWWSAKPSYLFQSPAITTPTPSATSNAPKASPVDLGGSDVPDTDRANIIDAYTRKGYKTITEAMINDAYNQKQRTNGQ